MGRQQLTVGPQLAQTRLHEHGNVGGAVVGGAVYLGVVAQSADVVSQKQSCLAHGAVGAEVGRLGEHARNRLSPLVVLLEGDADGVLEPNPSLLVLEGVAAVVAGHPHLAKPQVPGLGLYLLRNVLARRRFNRRLDVAIHAGKSHYLLGKAHVFPVALLFLLRIDRPCPLRVSRVGDALAFQGVGPGVEVHVLLVLANAGGGDEVLCYRNFNGWITVSQSGPL